jgi:hypothetical protein
MCPPGVKDSMARFKEHGEVRDQYHEPDRHGRGLRAEAVGHLQHVPVLHGPLRVVKGPDMVLTLPDMGSSVNSYRGITYTVDQVYPMGKGVTG